MYVIGFSLDDVYYIITILRNTFFFCIYDINRDRWRANNDVYILLYSDSLVFTILVVPVSICTVLCNKTIISRRSKFIIISSSTPIPDHYLPGTRMAYVTVGFRRARLRKQVGVTWVDGGRQRVAIYVRRIATIHCRSNDWSVVTDETLVTSGFVDHC